MPEADYRTVEKLGKGAFSQVYKVERRADNTTRVSPASEERHGGRGGRPRALDVPPNPRA